MHAQHRVVGFNNCRCHLGTAPHGKGDLRFLSERRSNIRQPKPDPVPPPQALYTQKPCNPVQLSASLRIRSRTKSTISFPIV
eukprot:Skav211719  [mRNA]  locus=scaffold2852:669111:669871:+ [translate_table: standard]